MPSLQAQYNREVLEGHREALAALRDLLATETDRTERRRLANAILKTRKVQDPDEDESPTSERTTKRQPARTTRSENAPGNTAAHAAAINDRSPLEPAPPEPQRPDSRGAPARALSNPQRTG
jgi:hypothetical protein